MGRSPRQRPISRSSVLLEVQTVKWLRSLASLSVSLAACGGGSGTTTLYCGTPSHGYCFSETLPSSSLAAYQPTFDAVCAVNAATAVPACASENRVGRCTRAHDVQGVTQTTVWSYYASNYTAADVQALCEGAGWTFTAG